VFFRLRAENTAREATQRCNELKDKLMLQHTVQRLDLTKQHLVRDVQLYFSAFRCISMMRLNLY
jgi:hypothetical protein